MGVSVRTELVDELDTLVDECSDLGAACSEIVEAILTSYLQNDESRKKRRESWLSATENDLTRREVRARCTDFLERYWKSRTGHINIVTVLNE